MLIITTLIMWLSQTNSNSDMVSASTYMIRVLRYIKLNQSCIHRHRVLFKSLKLSVWSSAGTGKLSHVRAYKADVCIITMFAKCAIFHFRMAIVMLYFHLHFIYSASKRKMKSGNSMWEKVMGTFNFCFVKT